MSEEKRIALELSIYKDKGLYIIIEPIIVKLTEKVIRETAQDFWSDYSKIPQDIRDNFKFQRCPHCPIKEGLCDTLKVVLPFLNFIDRYQSFDQAITVYKGDSDNIYHLSDTTMQEALKYTAILALTQYCAFGKKYRKYFYGVIPTLPPDEIAERIYLNAHFIHQGNEKEIANFIVTVRNGFTESIQRQTERLRLICKNDVFLNAFVGTQTATEFLLMDIADRVKKKLAGQG